MTFIANSKITINTIEQKDTETRKLIFLKYKNFLALGARKSRFPKYKKEWSFIKCNKSFKLGARKFQFLEI